MPAARRVLALTAGLTALLSASAAPALAAPTIRQLPHHAPVVLTSPHTTGPHGGVLNSTSSNWAGYSATGGKYTSVSASWIQPTATCTETNTWSSFWVGLDGDGSDSVEQTGTEADCSGGSPVYSSWYEMYPAYPVNYSDPVAPGDHFSASVTEALGRFTLKITDETQGWSHTVRKTSRSAKLASAEVIAEAPSNLAGPLPLTDFGTVAFTGATANGKPLGSFKPDGITMAKKDGTVLASISPLSANGEDFTSTWHHS
ncbi:G1 family glutamic endopeptidase [Kitasatospora viridis]|uniref:Peptidase A4-like protein n=1 Tax=Kitasatospora viridis TaxID=281105 RepID=A0A561UNX8_9ACTN|nr:G1 family glutamic endopeptidase [Kitasatospora viridis]TWG01061.1 peptidase A4-like protein [Kitasatospora viridis]